MTGDYFSNKEDIEAVPESPADSAQPQSAQSENVNEPSYKKYQKAARVENYKKRREEEEKKREELQMQQAQQRKSGLALFAGIGFVLMLVLLFIFWPRNVKTVVDQKFWQRDIAVEEYKTVQESDWSVPEGGRVIETRREVHHYDQVLDHYEQVQVLRYKNVLDGYDNQIEYVNNGDGTFSEKTVQVPRYRSEPYYEIVTQPVYRNEAAYKTKYYYEIERWMEGRHITTQGGNDPPYWGDLNLSAKEREIKRTGIYTLVFRDSKKRTYTTGVTEEMWNSLKEKSSVSIKVSNGRVLEINGQKIQ